MQAAIQEARQGLAEGGIPIGSVLVIDGKIVGRGHNRRIQKGSAVLHAEMDALESRRRRWIQEFYRRHAGFEIEVYDLRPEKARKIDGVIVGGPEGFAYPALWENKCLGNKSWSDLERKGLAISKPIYAAQVAIYQAYLELTEHPAIFTAINADTMEIYTELVPFDAALAQRMSDRAVKVITATEAGELLPRAVHDSTHFECRMCAWQDRCWSNT